MMSGTIKGLLHPHDQRLIADAIRIAEKRTAAEFKVHVEPSNPNPQARARALVDKLKVSRTAARNGVLVYAAIRDRRCVVVADVGLRAQAESAAWKGIVERASVEFRNGRFGHGLAQAVLALSEELRGSQPRRADDVNEVDDGITSPSLIPEE
jgi:uncharacterized membrane protein